MSLESLQKVKLRRKLLANCDCCPIYHWLLVSRKGNIYNESEGRVIFSLTTGGQLMITVWQPVATHHLSARLYFDSNTQEETFKKALISFRFSQFFGHFMKKSRKQLCKGDVNYLCEKTAPRRLTSWKRN